MSTENRTEQEDNLTHEDIALYRLGNVYNNFIMSSLSMFIYVKKLYRLDMDSIQINSIDINVKKIKDVLSKGGEDSDILLNELSKSFLRIFYNESFDVFNTYLLMSGRMNDDVTNRQWYTYAKIIRDSITAYTSFSFFFDDDLKDKLPVKLGDNTITADMEGQPVPFAMMDYNAVMQLFNNYKIFISSNEHNKG